jgi:hypothetical protein
MSNDLDNGPGASSLVEPRPEKAFTAALIGFCAIVLSGFFGRPEEDPAAIVALCAFAVAIPLLSVFWVVAYAANFKHYLPWVENVFVAGLAASLVGFGAGLLQVNVIALTVFSISIVVAFLLVLAAAQGWGRPKGPGPDWKPTYQPRNDIPD